MLPYNGLTANKLQMTLFFTTSAVNNTFIFIFQRHKNYFEAQKAEEKLPQRLQYRSMAFITN